MNDEELKEFSLFLKGNVEPRPPLSKVVLAFINKELNPSIPWTVFKLFLFHVFGSALTLLFCPQYGVSFIGSSQGIMTYLMKIHPAICFVACGLIWMVGGQILSYVFLTIDEKRVLGNYRWSFAFATLGMSLLMFACLGSLTFDMWLLFWLLGALSIVSLCNLRIDRELQRIRNRSTVQI